MYPRQNKTAAVPILETPLQKTPFTSEKLKNEVWHDNPPGPRMKNTVVAIFEDDKVNCFIHEKLFNFVKAPVSCHLFDNPEKGYETARQIEFDIVFIEIHFWGDNLSGIDILHKLKAIHPKEFIAVAMTSLLQQGDVERILSAGFSMCIEKPLIFKEISGLLNVTDKK